MPAPPERRNSIKDSARSRAVSVNAARTREPSKGSLATPAQITPKHRMWVFSILPPKIAKYHQELVPPSTVRLAPVRFDASSPATNDTLAAISSTVQRRESEAAKSTLG